MDTGGEGPLPGGKAAGA